MGTGTFPALRGILTASRLASPGLTKKRGGLSARYDDQIVPYADTGPLSAKLVQNGTLKTFHGYPHGMPTTHAETINADLLSWLQS